VPVREVRSFKAGSIALAACALLLTGAAIGWAAHKAADPDPVVREALAQSTHPKGAKGRTLGLSRVTIQPGASIALHHHEGTQIAYIKSGVLTYSVHTGQVKVRRGLADENPQVVRTISAGETGKIKAGQWIVEQPNTHHSAANHGKNPIVIFLGTLLKHGAAPSTPG
jgi:quercetin dioxygenase-like cupin family protein